MTKRGFSIIQVVITMGLMGFLAMVFYSMTSQQSKANQNLAQRMEILDIQRHLMMTFSNPANCLCQLNPSSGTKPTFNRSGANASMTLGALYQGCTLAGLPTTPILSVGQIVPNSQGLKVSSIAITSINNVGASSPNEYVGDMEVQFSGSVAAKAPITIKQMFSIDPASPAATTTVSSCSGLGGSYASDIDFTNPTKFGWSGFSTVNYSLGVFKLCLLTGTGTNNGGCYFSKTAGTWSLVREAYALNTNCQAWCYN